MQVPFQVDLRKKVAVLTGGGGVICGEFARALAACGARVALLDINFDAAKKIADEIAQGNKLMKAQAYEDAERYAAVMCGFYPAKSRAWELLIAARCAKDENYDPARDLEFFMRCPDFEMTYGRPLDGVLPQNVSPIIRDRVRETERKKQKSAAFWKKAVASAITLAGLAVLALVWE